MVERLNTILDVGNGYVTLTVDLILLKDFPGIVYCFSISESIIILYSRYKHGEHWLLNNT